MYENYSVLFVDDEVNILSSLKRGLIDEEYKCHFVTGGTEALKIMETEKIAVIVSDMRMPQMDGLALLKIVKEKYPQTVRIVLSGYTQLQQILTTINQVDVFKFITKPWKLEEEIKNVIYDALEYYKLREQNEEFKVALQKKNIAYQNILKNIEITIANTKRSSEVLGTCGKAILAYIKSHNYSIDEKFGAYQEKIYDFFANAVIGEEKEYRGDKFTEEFSKFIQSNIKVSKVDNKLDCNLSIKCITDIVEVALLSCICVFHEEFEANNLFVNFRTNQNGNVVIGLISSYEAKNEEVEITLDAKIDFINSVLINTLSLSKMTFSAKRVNGNVVVALVMDGI